VRVSMYMGYVMYIMYVGRVYYIWRVCREGVYYLIGVWVGGCAGGRWGCGSCLIRTA
jgi:hypothetical protein